MVARTVRQSGVFHSLRPLLIGIVHGLAGSAAVALLVLSTIHDPRWGVFYLLIFGLGTIAGMMLITAAMSLPFSYAGTRFAWLNRGLVTGSGVLSLAFGLFVVYQIGIVDGLFTSHPMWSPNRSHLPSKQSLWLLGHGLVHRLVNRQKILQARHRDDRRALRSQAAKANVLLWLRRFTNSDTSAPIRRIEKCDTTHV